MIYLDNAATTYPKPQAVYEEVYRCMTRYGGNPGRGAHSLSLGAAQKIFECRSLIADLFDVGELERVVFTLNTTYALNMAIKGLLRRGDHVIISDLEHNAVYRPVVSETVNGNIRFDIFNTFDADPDAIIRDMIRKKWIVPGKERYALSLPLS